VEEEAQQPYVGPRDTNGYAVASLVLGIIWLAGLGSLLAILFGYIGRRQINRSGGRESGYGLATAGIVLGCVGILLPFTIGLLIGFGSSDSGDSVSVPQLKPPPGAVTPKPHHKPHQVRAPTPQQTTTQAPTPYVPPAQTQPPQQDTPQHDTAPPKGSPAAKFEQFCKDNPGAC
jgi:hypothetical protein